MTSRFRTTMVTCLELEGVHRGCRGFHGPGEAIDRLQSQSYPIVISDIYLDERTGIDVLHKARQQNPDCAVILMTGRGSMETVMAATSRAAAFEYLVVPSRSRWRAHGGYHQARRKNPWMGKSRTRRPRSTICRIPR